MNRSQREIALKVAKTLLPKEEFDRVASLKINDQGYGYDPFGMEKESLIIAYAFVRYIYKNYFCVESAGHEHIPADGRALLVSNHSGVLPIDGMMTVADVFYRLSKPRVVRSIVDNFVGFLPFVNVFFDRVGQVMGARRNFADLLESEEIVLVFPEGTKGLGKPYSRKYKLARFNVGFIELALTHRTPIVPLCVVGAEEQAPMLADLAPIGRLFGFPYFPITPLFPLLGPLGMLPLPVQYYIQYGEPIHLYKDYPPEAVEDPELVRQLADNLQLTVQDMINDLLKKREVVFTVGKRRRENNRRRKRRRA